MIAWYYILLLVAAIVGVLVAGYNLRTRLPKAAMVLASAALFVGVALGLHMWQGWNLPTSSTGQAAAGQAPPQAPPAGIPPARVAMADVQFIQTGKWTEVTFPIIANLPASTSPRWAFVGTLPPVSFTNREGERKTRVEIKPQSAGHIGRYFTVIGACLKFKPRDLAGLKAMDWDTRSKSTYVYQLPSVPFMRDMGNSDPENVSDIYVQSSESSASEVFATYEPRGNVKQWWVDLDREGSATFDLPSGWEHVWLLPIHDPDYFGSYIGEPTSPNGIGKTPPEVYEWSYRTALVATRDRAKATQTATEAREEGVRNLPFPLSDVPYAGIYWQDAKRVKALNDSENFSSRRGNLSGPLTLGINMPHGEVLTKPVRMLVGVSFAD